MQFLLYGENMSAFTKTSQFLFLSFTLLSANCWASCSDCVSVNGNVVMVNEVGVVDGDYFYAITNRGKIQLPANGYDLAKLAFIYSKEMWVNTSTKNYTIVSR